MTIDKTTFRIARDIRHRRILDEAVVVRQETNEVILINEVSASILEFLEKHEMATVDSMIDYLASEYEVDKKVLEVDMQDHIEELLAAGIITSEG